VKPLSWFPSALLVFTVWTWSAPVHANPLTLGEVLDSVLQTHPQIDGATRSLEATEGEVMAAAGGFDPKLGVKGKWIPFGYYRYGHVDTVVQQPTPLWGLGLYAGYRIGWGDVPAYYGELETQSAGEIRAGVDLPLWKGGRIDKPRARIARAKTLRSEAQSSLSATTLSVQRSAAHAYWDWVAAGQSLAIARELLSVAQERDAALRAQAAEGAIEAIAVVDNRRLMLERQGKVVGAEQKFREAGLALALFLRDSKRRPVPPGEDRLPASMREPELFDVVLEEEVPAALARRPDLAAYDALREAAAVDVRLARNQVAPEIRLQSYVAKDLGSGPASLDPVEWGTGVFVEMPLPLRTARGELRSAQAKLAGIEAKMRGVRDQVEVEVRRAHVGVQASMQRLELARAQVEAADTLAQGERTRFEEGMSDLVVVNLRELAAASAREDLVRAAAEVQRAQVDFWVATGRAILGG